MNYFKNLRSMTEKEIEEEIKKLDYKMNYNPSDFQRKRELLEEIDRRVYERDYKRHTKRAARIYNMKNNKKFITKTDETSKAGRLHRKYQKNKKHQIFENDVLVYRKR